MTGESLISQAVVIIFLCIGITVHLRRVATALDIDQERSILHNIVSKNLPSLRLSLLLCPGEVSPLTLLYLIHQGVVLVEPLGCVGHPHLVALEYLRCAALATACPAAVSLAIAQLI